MSERKIKAVVLDCDGVILDSNHAYEKLYEKLFRKYGINKKPKEIYSHFGESPMHILHVIFPGRDVKNIFIDYKCQLKDPVFNKKIKINKGAKNAIKKLSRTYKIVVASGALRFRLLRSLRKFGLMKYFEFVMGSDEVKNAKPHPEMLLKIIKKLRVKKNHVIFVGDAPNDLKAAKRASIKFAAVLSGVLDKKTAKRMKADYIISDITKLENLLKHLNR